MTCTALRAFLEAPTQPDGTLSYHELQGFLFAVACAPELVPPSEWFPIIFNEHEPRYESRDQLEAVMAELMALYNEVNASVFEGVPALPPDCRLARTAMANLDDKAPVAQWARGFVEGHEWLGDLWDVDMPEEIDQEVGAVLMTLSFFASKELAEAYCEESGGGSLAELARMVKRLFPEALASYAAIGRSLQQVAGAAPSGPSVPRVKVGRNDLCACGSGRKYKRCCGAGSSH